MKKDDYKSKRIESNNKNSDSKNKIKDRKKNNKSFECFYPKEGRIIIRDKNGCIYVKRYVKV